jgi:hypothetical protein
MNMNTQEQEPQVPPGAQVMAEVGRLLRNLRFGPHQSAYARGSHSAIHIHPRPAEGEKTIKAYLTCYAFGHRTVGWAGLPILLECADPAAAEGIYLEFLNGRGQAVFGGLPAREYSVNLLPVEAPSAAAPQEYETAEAAGTPAAPPHASLGIFPATFACPGRPLIQGHVEVLIAPVISLTGELVIGIRIPEPYCDPGTAAELAVLTMPAGTPLGVQAAVTTGELQVLHVPLPPGLQEKWGGIAATRWDQLPLRFVVRSPEPPASG